jgi:uncharacterized membrane protein
LFKSVLIITFVAFYALISHFSLLLPGGKTIAAALAVGLPALALTWFTSQLVHPLLTKIKLLGQVSSNSSIAVALALFMVLPPLWWAWPVVLANSDVLYFAQHLGTNALLAWLFGHTLAPRFTPLVVTFARIVHRDLPPEIEVYARQVTLAWTLFFLITCMLSVVLFFTTPLAVWSTFAVLLQWPSVVLFFVAEYALRRILFRKFDHASMKQGFDAYLSAQRHANPKPVIQHKR